MQFLCPVKTVVLSKNPFSFWTQVALLSAQQPTVICGSFTDALSKGLVNPFFGRSSVLCGDKTAQWLAASPELDFQWIDLKTVNFQQSLVIVKGRDSFSLRMILNTEKLVFIDSLQDLNKKARGVLVLPRGESSSRDQVRGANADLQVKLLPRIVVYLVNCQNLPALSNERFRIIKVDSYSKIFVAKEKLVYFICKEKELSKYGQEVLDNTSVIVKVVNEGESTYRPIRKEQDSKFLLFEPHHLKLKEMLGVSQGLFGSKVSATDDEQFLFQKLRKSQDLVVIHSTRYRAFISCNCSFNSQVKRVQIDHPDFVTNFGKKCEVGKQDSLDFITACCTVVCDSQRAYEVQQLKLYDTVIQLRRPQTVPILYSDSLSELVEELVSQPFVKTKDKQAIAQIAKKAPVRLFYFPSDAQDVVSFAAPNFSLVEVKPQQLQHYRYVSEGGLVDGLANVLEGIESRVRVELESSYGLLVKERRAQSQKRLIFIGNNDSVKQSMEEQYPDYMAYQFKTVPQVKHMAGVHDHFPSIFVCEEEQIVELRELIEDRNLEKTLIAMPNQGKQFSLVAKDHSSKNLQFAKDLANNNPLAVYSSVEELKKGLDYFKKNVVFVYTEKDATRVQHEIAQTNVLVYMLSKEEQRMLVLYLEERRSPDQQWEQLKLVFPQFVPRVIRERDQLHNFLKDHLDSDVKIAYYEGEFRELSLVKEQYPDAILIELEKRNEMNVEQSKLSFEVAESVRERRQTSIMEIRIPPFKQEEGPKESRILTERVLPLQRVSPLRRQKSIIKQEQKSQQVIVSKDMCQVSHQKGVDKSLETPAKKQSIVIKPAILQGQIISTSIKKRQPSIKKESPSVKIEKQDSNQRKQQASEPLKPQLAEPLVKVPQSKKDFIFAMPISEDKKLNNFLEYYSRKNKRVQCLSSLQPGKQCVLVGGPDDELNTINYFQSVKKDFDVQLLMLTKRPYRLQKYFEKEPNFIGAVTSLNELQSLMQDSLSGECDNAPAFKPASPSGQLRIFVPKQKEKAFNAMVRGNPIQVVGYSNPRNIREKDRMGYNCLTFIESQLVCTREIKGDIVLMSEQVGLYKRELDSNPNLKGVIGRPQDAKDYLLSRIQKEESVRVDSLAPRSVESVAVLQSGSQLFLFAEKSRFNPVKCKTEEDIADNTVLLTDHDTFVKNTNFLHSKNNLRIFVLTRSPSALLSMNHSLPVAGYFTSPQELCSNVLVSQKEESQSLIKAGADRFCRVKLLLVEETDLQQIPFSQAKLSPAVKERVQVINESLQTVKPNPISTTPQIIVFRETRGTKESLVSFCKLIDECKNQSTKVAVFGHSLPMRNWVEKEPAVVAFLTKDQDFEPMLRANLKLDVDEQTLLNEASFSQLKEMKGPKGVCYSKSLTHTSKMQENKNLDGRNEIVLVDEADLHQVLRMYNIWQHGSQKLLVKSNTPSDIALMFKRFPCIAMASRNEQRLQQVFREQLANAKPKRRQNRQLLNYNKFVLWNLPKFVASEITSKVQQNFSNVKIIEPKPFDLPEDIVSEPAIIVHMQGKLGQQQQFFGRFYPGCAFFPLHLKIAGEPRTISNSSSCESVEQLIGRVKPLLQQSSINQIKTTKSLRKLMVKEKRSITVESNCLQSMGRFPEGGQDKVLPKLIGANKRFIVLRGKSFTKR